MIVHAVAYAGATYTPNSDSNAAADNGRTKISGNYYHTSISDASLPPNYSWSSPGTDLRDLTASTTINIGVNLRAAEGSTTLGDVTGAADTGHTLNINTGGTVGNTFNMFTTTSKANTLNMQGTGTLSGTVNVGRGAININNSAAPVGSNGSTITGAINTTVGTSVWTLSAGTFTGTGSVLSAGGDGNTFNISSRANFDSDARINTAGTSASINIGGMIAANTTGFDGKINMASTNNTLNVNAGANYNANAAAAITGGTTNRVNIDIGNANAWDFRGVVNLAAATGDTAVTITSGVLHNATNAASIVGKASGAYRVLVDGGYTTYANSNTGDGQFVFSNGGQIYNISNAAAGKTATGTSTATYTDANHYLSYSLLNMNTVTLAGGSSLTIGYNADPSLNNSYNAFSLNNAAVKGDGSNTAYNHDFMAGQEAQISTNRLAVEAGTTLIIHENAVHYGVGYDGTFDADSNVVDNLDVWGTVTLDRTTIHSRNPDATRDAPYIVHSGGVLHGFSEFDFATDHTPLRPNMVSDLLVEDGGKIQPYNKAVFTINSQNDTIPGGAIERLMGVTMVIDGNTTWEQNSWLSTRMFARTDGTQMGIDGVADPQGMFFSDAVNSTTFDFNRSVSSVWNGTTEVAQDRKVQYDPVFGFSYELRAKHEFQVYKGDGSADDPTYYFNVANSTGSEIAGLYRNAADNSAGYMPDANHLFNRDILKSDMLGEWQFLSTADHDGIVLRYRMLAEHPTNGGIAIDMVEPNAREAARKIDEMRYPFATDHTDLAIWPTVDQSRVNYIWGEDGFDGNVVTYYAANQPAYDNYQPYFVDDFERFLHAVQREILSGNTLNQAMRLLSAEPYATSTSVNFDVMRQFINNRERNAVSALFQVEEANYMDAAARAEANGGDTFAADMERDMPTAFVCNPARFWATGFGSDARHNKRGTEYGYDTDVYGASLGVIKEFGDVYLGLTGGYARVDNDWNELKANAKTNTYLAEALAGARIGMGFVELHADWALNDHKISRHVQVDDYYGKATGDYDDHTFGGGLRLGYQKLFDCQWLLIPTIGVQYFRNDNFSDFAEDGRYDMFCRLKFKSGAMRRNIVQIPAMIRLNRSIAVGGVVVTPEVRAGATATLGRLTPGVEYEYLGNPLSNRYMKAVGYNHGRFSGQVGASIEVSRRGRFYAAVNYDYHFAKRSHNHNYSLQAGINF